MVYLVVTRHSLSIHSLHLDEEEARTDARSIRGVLVAVPIVEDFREQ